MSTSRRMWSKEELGGAGGGGGVYVHVVNNEDGYPCGIISLESRPYSEFVPGFTSKNFSNILNIDKLALKFCPSLEYGTCDNPLDWSNAYQPIINAVDANQGGYIQGQSGKPATVWTGDTSFHCTTDTVIKI